VASLTAATLFTFKTDANGSVVAITEVPGIDYTRQ